MSTSNSTWIRERPRQSPSAKGLLLIAATLVLLLASIVWLRSSIRYQGAVELSTAARLILTNSPFDVDPQTLIQAAADGMTSLLDPYSAYLSPAELELLTEETEGTYRGVGIEIRRRDGNIFIADVFPQSPAQDAGLRPGDRIISIQGVLSIDLQPEEMVEIVRGPESATIDFLIQTPTGVQRSHSLTPRAVEINPFPLTGITRSGIGYIRWEHFTEGSADQLAALVEELRVEETVGLILDLRGNPGGIVEEAVNAAGLFLPPNSLVCTLVGRDGIDSIAFLTGSALPIYQDALIVVQDDLTSSSAEILAAALADAGRAVIVGRRSFGKGWVQNVFPLDDGGGLRLSTAFYLTPSGERIGNPKVAREQFDSLLAGGIWRGEGLVADVVVPESSGHRWEALLARERLITEYVSSRSDEWSASGVEDSSSMMRDLARWIGKKNIAPDGPAATLIAMLTEPTASGSARPVPAAILNRLRRAISVDNKYLLHREAPGLMRQIWEERLRQVDDPDPGELEAYIEFDVFLSTARNLLEQPERFESILAGVPERATK